MYKIHRIFSLICCLICLPLLVRAEERLTVVVLVDGMNDDDLRLMRPYWPQGGLRTLSEEAYQTTVGYPHAVYGGDETTATLMTGTTPTEHGICMNRYFDRATRQVVDILADANESGIATPTAYSARNLLSPTISDKIRMRYGEEAGIYAIGIEPTTTILLAGHAANACCWLGAPSAYEPIRWVSTSYYSEGLPSEADEMNVNGRFEQISARMWTPRLDISMYNQPTDDERRKGFNYRQGDVLRHSPGANTLVTELALAIQKKNHLGEDNVPDLLLLQMTVLSPNAKTDRILSAEQEDMYLSLNQDLGYLMEQLERRIGKNSYRLLVIGRPIAGTDDQRLEAAHLPIRSFNADRAAALTSTYLMALYGHERWIDGGYGQAIFLNRTLIEQKHLSLPTIQRQVADFLMEFEGVNLAMPASEVYLTRYADSFQKRFTGDVVFFLQPFTRLTHTGKNGEETIDRILDPHPTSPLLFWSGSHFSFPEGKIDATKVINLVDS